MNGRLTNINLHIYYMEGKTVTATPEHHGSFWWAWVCWFANAPQPLPEEFMSIRFTSVLLLIAAIVPAIAQTNHRITVPKIRDDPSLELIAALGVRPGHFTSAEWYAMPAGNLKAYKVYRPDREPRGHSDWLPKQNPEPLVDAPNIHTPARNYCYDPLPDCEFSWRDLL
jgi:hypothetical protein